jgi:hypothetical protein
MDSKQRGFAMRRFLPFASAVLFLALTAPVSTVSAQQVGSVSQQERDELASGFQQAVQELKPTLPRQLDEVTTLIDVASDDVVMIYNHTITLNLTPAIQEKLAEHLRKTVCGTEVMRQTLVWGATYRYSYQDKDGNPVAAFDISGRDCGLA